MSTEETEPSGTAAFEAEEEVLPRFAVPSSSKRAEHLAARIVSEIVRRDWPVGEMLGTEPGLTAKYGVSRSAFRQAVGILEHDGVATMRQGSAGGLVVTPPNGDSFRRTAMMYLDYRKVSLGDLFEARVAAESLAIDLAGRHLDERGIAELRRAVLEDRDPTEEQLMRGSGLGHGHALHLVVAELSGNPVIRLVVDVLLSLTEREFDPEKVVEPDDLRMHSHRAHHAIAEALVAGDIALARHRTTRHLRAMEAFLLAYERGEDRS